jgi:ABC-2 type transport system ATP-binding protein
MAIDLRGVRKTFKGKVEALRGIDMQVPRGEIFGLLGPNGAGKSTLVKIMLTVVRATAVTGTVLGEPIGRKSALARMGYLPEKHLFPEYLTGRQAIDFSGEMMRVERSARRKRTAELLELVGMAGWADRKMGTYSKGMQQRIGLAAAMVNDPDLVVLDEPTDGVDPVGRKDIRDVLVAMKQRGTSVFLNSHLLSELEMVCDRVAILVQGEVAAHGTIEELTNESRRYEIEIAGAAPTWAKDEGVRITQGTSELETLLVKPTAEAAQVQHLLDRLRSDGHTIVSVRPVRESLEDLFMRYVKDPVTGKTKAPGAVRGERSS